MQDQHASETPETCINSAPKPKSLGQVGYEALLSLGTCPDDLLWQNLPKHIHAAWEMVALAIISRVVEDIRSSLGVKL